MPHVKFGLDSPSSFGNLCENGGRRTDNGPKPDGGYTIISPYMYEPGSVEKTSSPKGNDRSPESPR